MTSENDLAAYHARTHALLREVRGTVLEIGAGTGANFAAFAPDVRWIGLEPSRRRRSRLAAVAESYGHHEPILAATAEDIPLPDGSVDAVVSTIVLCSVFDQDRALAQIARVLRPGGRLVFAEHVAARRGTLLLRAQRLIAPFSRLLDSGCDPARDTVQALRRAPFRTVEIGWFGSGRRFSTTFIAGYAQP